MNSHRHLPATIKFDDLHFPEILLQSRAAAVRTVYGDGYDEHCAELLAHYEDQRRKLMQLHLAHVNAGHPVYDPIREALNNSIVAIFKLCVALAVCSPEKAFTDYIETAVKVLPVSESLSPRLKAATSSNC